MNNCCFCVIFSISIYDISKNSKLSVRETILNHENLDEKKKANYINLIESIEKIEKGLIVDREFLDNLSNVYKDIMRNKEKLKIYTIDAFFNIIFNQKNLPFYIIIFLHKKCCDIFIFIVFYASNFHFSCHIF